MSEHHHKSDGAKEHAARVAHHLRSGGCHMRSGGAVQENEKSFDKEVKEVSGKSKKAAKPEFKRAGRAHGKKPHHRLDKHARGGAVKLKKGGKAEGKGNKINIVVAPHPQGPMGAPGGLAGQGPAPMPPRPPMMAPPPGGPPGGAPMPGGPPPGMPMRPPGMAKGGKVIDGGLMFKRGGHKAAGGSTSSYEGKQEDLGGESESQASNQDQNMNPPKRASGGAIRHTMRHPTNGRFIRGGRVNIKEGAGSGEGRLAKVREYGATQPHGKH